MASTKIKRSSESRFKEIPQNTILNNVKESGLYWCNGVYMHPDASSVSWGMLIVVANEAQNNIKQIFSFTNDNHFMTRYYNGTWSSWVYTNTT